MNNTFFRWILSLNPIIMYTKFASSTSDRLDVERTNKLFKLSIYISNYFLFFLLLFSFFSSSFHIIYIVRFFFSFFFFFFIFFILFIFYLNETPEQKGKWKLHKKAAYWFEQILQAAPLKTTVVRPLTYHLTNYPSKTNKACWALLDMYGRTHKRRSPTNIHTHRLASLCRPA